MTTTDYQLIVESLGSKGFYRSFEDHDTTASLIESAAEYRSGEYPGNVVGAIALTYDHNRQLIAVAPIATLDAMVADVLADSPAWAATHRALAQEDRALRSRAL